MTGRANLGEELTHRVRLGEARLALDLALGRARRPVVSSKFGPDSAVFLHFVTRAVPDVPVVRVETGYDTRATLRFVDELVGRLGLNLHVVRPEGHRIVLPPALDDPAHAAFAREVKIRPFERALRELGADVWLSSIRRHQSAHRGAEPAFRTLGSGVLKASPLLGWTPDTVARYAAEHGLPTGPEAFDPTKGEPFRECGLHLVAGA